MMRVDAVLAIASFSFLLHFLPPTVPASSLFSWKIFVDRKVDTCVFASFQRFRIDLAEAMENMPVDQL